MVDWLVRFTLCCIFMVEVEISYLWLKFIICIYTFGEMHNISYKLDVQKKFNDVVNSVSMCFIVMAHCDSLLICLKNILKYS